MPLPARGSVVVGATASILTSAGAITDETSWLTGAERAQLARRRPEADRRDRLAARVLIRQLVAEHLGLGEWGEVAVRQHCPRCEGRDHGRPTVELGGQPIDLAVSFSRSRGFVAAAVAPGADGPLGVDLEVTGAAAFGLSIAQWCQVEAAVKAGLGDLDTLVAGVADGLYLPLGGLQLSEAELSFGPQSLRVCALSTGPLLPIRTIDP